MPNLLNYEKRFDHVVRYEAKDGIAHIILDCPQNNNRVNEQLADELGDALRNAEYDTDVKATVITANGDIFAGTGDPATLTTRMTNIRDARIVMTRVHRMIQFMYYSSKPIISAVDGLCAGAGVTLALSSDFVIASEKAIFNLVFADYALSPDTGGLWALQRLVGTMRAKEIAMLPRPINAQEALKYGMVMEVVPSKKIYDEVFNLARELASKSPLAIGQIKQLSNRMNEYSLHTYLQLEADYISIGLSSDDFKESFAAQRENRTPIYEGK